MKNKFLKLDIKYIFPFLFIFFILFNITAEPALATSSSMVEYSFDFSDPDAALSFFQDSPLNEGAVPPYVEDGELYLRIDSSDALPGFSYDLGGAVVANVSWKQRNNTPGLSQACSRIVTVLFDTSDNVIAAVMHLPYDSFTPSKQPFGINIDAKSKGGYIISRDYSNWNATTVSTTGYRENTKIYQEGFSFDGIKGTLTYTLGNDSKTVESSSFKGKYLGKVVTFCYVEGSTYTVRTDEFNAVAIYPDTEPPTIELSYTPDTPTNGSVTINADVTDPLGVAETRYATSESEARTGTLFTGSLK